MLSIKYSKVLIVSGAPDITGSPRRLVFHFLLVPHQRMTVYPSNIFERYLWDDVFVLGHPLRGSPTSHRNLL